MSVPCFRPRCLPRSAVANEDRLAGYVSVPAHTAAESPAGPSVPSASIDVAPAYCSKQKAAAAHGVEEV